MSLSGGASTAVNDRGWQNEKRHKTTNINLMLFINAAFSRFDKTLFL
jgi:hypothetical protein